MSYKKRKLELLRDQQIQKLTELGTQLEQIQTELEVTQGNSSQTLEHYDNLISASRESTMIQYGTLEAKKEFYKRDNDKLSKLAKEEKRGQRAKNFSSVYIPTLARFDGKLNYEQLKNLLSQDPSNFLSLETKMKEKDKEFYQNIHKNVGRVKEVIADLEGGELGILNTALAVVKLNYQGFLLL